MIDFRNFWPVQTEVLFSRDIAHDPRLGDLVRRATTAEDLKPHVCICGYPDDEGILSNGGRGGAKEAPNRIRHFLYRMTPALTRPDTAPFFDLGNLRAEAHTIEGRHEVVQKTALSVLKMGGRWVGLGGGHDYGYPDGSALCHYAQDLDRRPLVINFDAHLDVRDWVDGINSGTPFSRLLSQFPDVEIAMIGLQAQSNSQEHFEWAHDHGVATLTRTEMLLSGKTPTLKILRFLEPYLKRGRPTFLSIDMDVFSSAYAPGCSQSWPLGLTPQDLFPVFDVLFRRLDVRVLGIYETSPPLDVADNTSRLAAEIVHHFLHSFREES